MGFFGPKGGGGTDWTAKTNTTSAPTAAHQANTHLNITGSGWLMGVLCGFDGTNHRFTIQVDGGDIWDLYYAGNNTDNTRAAGFGNVQMIRFNSSLVVKGNAAASNLHNAWAVLD